MGIRARAYREEVGFACFYNIGLLGKMYLLISSFLDARFILSHFRIYTDVQEISQ